MKNNIQVCLLVIFIAIAGIKCKPDSNNLRKENGFRVVFEETKNVPKEFHPDSLAKQRDSWNKAGTWQDIINSAKLKYSKYFTKHDGVLTIKTNNKTVQFVDKTLDKNNSGDDEIEDNHYLMFIPDIDSHLILRSFYYTIFGFYLISNKTGEDEEVWWIPYISPDRNRFAVASKELFPEGDDPRPNGIQIFEIVSDKYIKKFEQKFDWGPDNVRWLDNNTFIVDKYIADGVFKEKKAGYVIFKLVDGK